MSYKDWNARGDEFKKDVYIWLMQPSYYNSCARVEREDKSTAGMIAHLETIIADLKEYRRELAARYAELATMGYIDTLKIKREFSCWKNRVSFHVTIVRTYDDGTKEEISRDDYSGKERRTALARFEELKKQHPGIKTEKDLEKTYSEMNEAERKQWRAKREAENNA